KLNNLERYGVPYTAATKDYDRFLNQLVERKKYRFRLTANPTYRITDSKSGKSRVVPHITILQQTNWLLERTKKHGFEIVR
ncbi:type I-E CRISPR-associated protein Cas6/Cse3/CasE, partial [Streptomyces scabiei]